MKSIVLASLIFFCFSFSGAAQTAPAAKNDGAQYVGLKYTGSDALPDNIKDSSAGLITDVDAPKVYLVGEFRKGKRRMIWLNYQYARTPDGVHPKWEVKDVLSFPNPAKNDDLIILGTVCERNNQSDAQTVVLANFSPRTQKYTVRRAWRVNFETEKFETISIAGIRCERMEP